MGLEHLFQIWDLQAPLIEVMGGGGKGRGGKGWDRASGTKDLTMLDSKVGLKT